MERKLTLAFVAVLAGVIVVTCLFMVHNPINAERAVLNTTLANIGPVEAGFAKQEADTETLQQKLAAKPQLWKELLPPPEPPKPAPAAIIQGDVLRPARKTGHSRRHREPLASGRTLRTP